MTEETKPSANERQVGGRHYASSYQHWDFVIDARLGYFEGQITKYLARHRKKNGLQDAEKALHFSEKLLESVLKGRAYPMPLAGLEPLQRFLAEQMLTPVDADAITKIARWASVEDLRGVISAVKKVILSSYDKE